MPLHKWMITRRARSYYHELQASQYLPPEKIRELQEKKLRRLITHAYHHVAYYREKMDALGLAAVRHPQARRSAQAPVPEQGRRPREPALRSALGQPREAQDPQDQDQRVHRRAVRLLRGPAPAGDPLGRDAARHGMDRLSLRRPLRPPVAPDARDELGAASCASASTRGSIAACSFRRSRCPTHNIARFVAKLRAYRPVLLDGYAESFNFLAHYIKSHGLESFHPKAVISSAQVLPEQSREIIEKALGCGVFDKYGSREFSGIAYECEQHDGHHVVAESYIVEILKDGAPAKPGEWGEVVITDLNNFCAPLIRYRVGDLAVAMDDGGRLRLRARAAEDRAHRGARPGDHRGPERRVRSRHVLRPPVQGLRPRRSASIQVMQERARVDPAAHHQGAALRRRDLPGGARAAAAVPGRGHEDRRRVRRSDRDGAHGQAPGLDLAPDGGSTGRFEARAPQPGIRIARRRARRSVAGLVSRSDPRDPKQLDDAHAARRPSNASGTGDPGAQRDACPRFCRSAPDAPSNRTCQVPDRAFAESAPPCAPGCRRMRRAGIRVGHELLRAASCESGAAAQTTPPSGAGRRAGADGRRRRGPPYAKQRRRPPGREPARSGSSAPAPASGRSRDPGSTDRGEGREVEDSDELVVRDQPRPARAQGVPVPVPEQTPVAPARREQTLGRAALRDRRGRRGPRRASPGARRPAARSPASATPIASAIARPGQPRRLQRALQHGQRRLDAAQGEVEDEGHGRQQVARFVVAEQEERRSAEAGEARETRDVARFAAPERRAGSRRRTAAASAATAWSRSSRRSRARIRPASPRFRTSSRTGRASRSKIANPSDP